MGRFGQRALSTSCALIMIFTITLAVLTAKVAAIPLMDEDTFCVKQCNSDCKLTTSNTDMLYNCLQSQIKCACGLLKTRMGRATKTKKSKSKKGSFGQKVKSAGAAVFSTGADMLSKSVDAFPNIIDRALSGEDKDTVVEAPTDSCPLACDFCFGEANFLGCFYKNLKCRCISAILAAIAIGIPIMLIIGCCWFFWCCCCCCCC